MKYVCVFAVARLLLLYTAVWLSQTNKLFSSNCVTGSLSLFTVVATTLFGNAFSTWSMAAVEAAGDVTKFTAITCLSLLSLKLKTEKARALFSPTLHNFQNSIASFFYCCQTSPICPVGKSHIMELWWNDTDRGNGRTRTRTYFSVTFSTINLMWTGLVSTPAFVVRGRRLSACTMALLNENHLWSEPHMKTQSVPRSKHSPSLL